MVNKNCPCYNKIVVSNQTTNSVGYCVYNNTIDFSCDKCTATKDEKTDAIFMADQIEKSIMARRKRR